MENYPRLLIVTPAKNESENILRLSFMLESQSLQNFSWVLVIDSSDDDSSKVASGLSPKFPFYLLEYKSSGLLIKGGAFQTWHYGVDFGLKEVGDFDFIMKLDADVDLERDYFSKLFTICPRQVDLLGGVITGTSREQSEYVPGPVKIYSRRAMSLVQQLPVATGLDVMDEMICRLHGLDICVIKEAKFRMTRKIGHSQGKLHGRFRNGLVCRWTGYFFPYFVLHLIRYLFRSPYFIGSIWMMIGYITAGSGPYDLRLKRFHREIQKNRLSRLVRSPWITLRDLYIS
jgi:glycosyltransferase involved in cell wall biosynthesis